MKSLPDYSVAIRTLGRAGTKYQTLLNSLASQTHKPKEIVIYLAEGYPKPTETIGIEKIVYVKKGMVAQRALDYKEIDTEWILFLDDDVSIEPWGVEKMLSDTIKAGADVCAFDAFPHHQLSIKAKIGMALLLSSFPRVFNKSKGYTVTMLGADCYNPKPKHDTAWSTSNAGPGFICRKSDFLNLNFKEELWLDNTPIAFPDDKVMFFKMHLKGLKILTHYNCGFKHLDAGTSSDTKEVSEKLRNSIFSEAHNMYIFKKLYVRPNLPKWILPIRFVLDAYQSVALEFYYLHKRLRNVDFPEARKEGKKTAKLFIKSLPNK